jgi:DNA-directed RNA polymerase specialized sigma24 family protein
VGGVEEHGVREALARLTDRDREILLLVEWEGLKTEELAEVLGCRHVTARGRLFRARGRFRNFYRLLHQQPDNHWSDQPTALTTRESNS